MPGDTLSINSGQHYCEKCRRMMDGKNFYQYRNGDKCEMCKPCLTMFVNNYDESTFVWILEKFDVPYIKPEWDSLMATYAKDPKKLNGMTIIGRYLAKMKLNQWKNYRWADTDRLALEREAKAKLYGNEEEIAENRKEEMRKRFENGEISEAQWMTYQQIEFKPPEPDFTTEDGVISTGGGVSAEDPYVKVDIPTIELSDDEKVTLAVKWGKLYTAEDWAYLEQKYKDFMESFDIQGAARVDTMMQICKLSLKMNQALDSGDIDSYSKLARAYDALLKSAKFTEAQRKEEKTGDFDAVGQVVFFAEKAKGAIPRHQIETPADIVDAAIENLKRYNKDLILNDPSLAQMVENYIKKRESLAEQKKDMAEAAARGEEFVTIKDEDYAEFNELIHEEEDAEDDSDGAIE